MSKNINKMTSEQLEKKLNDLWVKKCKYNNEFIEITWQLRKHGYNYWYDEASKRYIILDTSMIGLEK